MIHQLAISIQSTTPNHLSQQDLEARVAALSQEAEGLSRARGLLENRLRAVTEEANAALEGQHRTITSLRTVLAGHRASDERLVVRAQPKCVWDKAWTRPTNHLPPHTQQAAEREAHALRCRLGEQQQVHAAEQAALLEVLAQAEGTISHQNMVVQDLKRRLALAEQHQQQFRAQPPLAPPPQPPQQQYVAGSNNNNNNNDDVLSNAAAALTAAAAAEEALGPPPGLGRDDDEANPSPEPTPRLQPQPEPEAAGKPGKGQTTPSSPPPPSPRPVQQPQPQQAPEAAGSPKAAAAAPPAVTSPGRTSTSVPVTKLVAAAAAAANKAATQRRRGYQIVDMDA